MVIQTENARSTDEPNRIHCRFDVQLLCSNPPPWPREFQISMVVISNFHGGSLRELNFKLTANAAQTHLQDLKGRIDLTNKIRIDL